MEDITQAIAQLPERRCQAQKAPEPLQSFLLALLDQQESELHASKDRLESND